MPRFGLEPRRHTTPRSRHRMGAPTALAGLVGLLTLIGAACGSDGRDYELPAPLDIVPADITPGTVPIPLVEPGPGAMMISSPAFASGAAIPQRFTITGENFSPSLSFTDVPDGTSELALIVSDPDAPFVHWLVTGLPGDTPALGEDSLPDAAVEHANDAAEFGWFGPNVLEGASGRLHFELFTFDQPLEVTDTDSQPDVITKIRLQSTGRAAFLARYGTG